jgi:hypothetical protein
VSEIALNGSLLEIPRAPPSDTNDKMKRAADKKENIRQRSSLAALIRSDHKHVSREDLRLELANVGN